MTSNYQLQRIDMTHLEAAAGLEALCFSEPWSVKALKLLTTPDAVGYICFADGQIAAYGGMLYAPFEGQITNIAVHPKARRQGFGRAVLNALIRDAKERDLEQIALEVRASNEAAIGLYEKTGFFVAGRRKNFYKKPAEDALVMLKLLKEDK